MPEWKNTDPRHEIYKRATIIVVYPSPAGHGRRLAAVARVETHHGYSVFAEDWENHSHIDVDAEWDPAWWWTRAPEPTS
jgi:hypothetical protein